MSNLSTFLPSGKPNRITTYTSGSGTFVPLNTTTGFALVTIVSGGQSGMKGDTNYDWPGFGDSVGGNGGTAGQMMQFWTKTIQSVSYAVGAGGATATGGGQNNGSNSRWGSIVVLGGGNGWRTSNNTNLIKSLAFPGISLNSGMSGGAGGTFYYSTNVQRGGNAPNFHSSPDDWSVPTSGTPLPNGTSIAGNTVVGVNNTYYGGAGGGDSIYGYGGSGGNSVISDTLNAGDGVAGTGYGAGGGGGGVIVYTTYPNPGTGRSGYGGAGSGGIIIIEEYVF